MDAESTAGLVVEPVEPRSKPSEEFMQALRDLGAGPDTLARAAGETKGRRRRKPSSQQKT